MNITQWLNDTAAASRPKQPKPTLQSPEPLAARVAAPNPVVRPSQKALRLRQRKGASSPLLAPELTPPETTNAKLREARKHDSTSISSASDIEQSSSHGSSSESEERPCSDQYRRRKRYKTRKDKYEPRLKRARHKIEHSNRREKTAKKKIKKHGKEKKTMIKGKTAAAVVQNFCAPNVQGERLILQHAPNMGLFKKGRASSPFRGRGIPDLAFSEMKLLQKQKGLHDAAYPVETTRNGRAKDKARQTEEEISAYFTPGRPPLRERDANHEFRKKPHSSSKAQRSQTQPARRDLSGLSLTRNPVEPRGTTAHTIRSRSASATYFSWSTSVPPDTRPAPRVQNVSAIHSEAHGRTPNGSNGSQHESNANTTRPRLHHQAKDLPTLHRQQQHHALKGSSKRIESQKTLHRQVVRDEVHSMTVEDREDNLERNRRFPESLHQNEEATLTTETFPLPSSPPGFAMQAEASATFNEGSQSGPRRRSETPGLAADPPYSSNPLDSLLQDCDQAAAEQVSVRLNAGGPVDDAVHFEDDNFQDSSTVPVREAHGLPLPQQDIRRTWRVFFADGNIQNPGYHWRYFEAPEPVRDDFDLDQPAPHIDWSPTNVQLQGEDDGFYGGSSSYATEGHTMHAQQGEEVGEAEHAEYDAVDDGGDDDDFWQPNILY